MLEPRFTNETWESNASSKNSYNVEDGYMLEPGKEGPLSESEVESSKNIAVRIAVIEHLEDRDTLQKLSRDENERIRIAAKERIDQLKMREKN